MIKLSICIPTYNRAPFLRELLDSIVPQATEEVEIVVSDNASSDDTESMIQRYQVAFPRLVYFRFNENQGADRNFIQCVESAAGAYCWLMGSDDKIEAGGVRKVLRNIQEHPELTGLSVNANLYDVHLFKKLSKPAVFPFKQDTLISSFEEFFPFLAYYSSYLSGQVVNRALWRESVKTKPAERFYNGYVHVYIILNMMKSTPKWLYLYQPFVRCRSGNDSFVDRGAYRRLEIDVAGFSRIIQEFFPDRGPHYVSTVSCKGNFDVSSQLLGANFKGSGIESDFWKKAFRVCWNYYRGCPVFWYKLVFFFLIPSFIWQGARVVFRQGVRRGRQLIKDCKTGKIVLKSIDVLLRCGRRLGWIESVSLEQDSPKKILFCNLAHLGDVVLATSILPHIRACYPEVQIGFLVGKWAQELIEDHEQVQWVHCLNHWASDRSPIPVHKKILHYLRQRSQVIKELASVNYDIAIDLYPFFPNAISLLYQAKIPVRVGYTKTGFGALLTHPVEWKETGKSMVEHHKELLLCAGLMKQEASASFLSPHLVYRRKAVSEVLLPSSYCIFHVGAGFGKKEWSKQKWKELLREFISRGQEVIFTGKGSREKQMIEEICKDQERAHDLSETLSLRGFINVIQRAKVIVTVDSAAGHIASAYHVPTVVLFTGLNSHELWRPQNPRSESLTCLSPCFPCLNAAGCSSMKCIQDISVEEVMQSVNRWL